MYLDFEYRGFCRKFKTGLILQERKYMKFETINPYSYDMPERETFMASVLQHYLNSLTRDQAREEIQKVVYQDETGKIVIEVKILASMFDMALEKAYGYLMHADDGDPLEKAIAYRLQEYKGEKIMKKMSYTFASFLHDCLTSLMDE